MRKVNYNRFKGEYEVGEGIVNDFMKKTIPARNVIRKAVKPFYPNITPLYETEQFHIPLANFAGPGTKIQKRVEKGDRGTTIVDEYAKLHDLAYLRIQNLLRNNEISQNEAKEMVRNADDILLEQINKNNYPKDVLTRLHKNLVNNGIRAKIIGEDIGLISPTKFVKEGEGKKIKKKNPAAKLFKYAEQNGLKIKNQKK